MYPLHTKKEQIRDFSRLRMLWDRYPQHHEFTLFSDLDTLLTEHETWQKDLEAEEGLREEYDEKGYERFLVQLSWDDLPCRYATMEKIEAAGPLPSNRYVDDFLEQFSHLDDSRYACFLFPEAFVSQFFVVAEVCKRAEEFHPIKSLFPDESTVHYLAVFDKEHMDDVLLMYHLLYTDASEDLFGGYRLYDYSLPWYADHLWQDGKVFRSPYLPDRLAKYQGAMPYHHNPAKTVYVRRNIDYILSKGYFKTELEFFHNLILRIMPLFQWWWEDLTLYEEKDGLRTDWRLERTKIRSRLTAEGVIKPKWKHELTLFQTIRNKYPGTLYQYRPDWLGRQSLDLFIPELNTAIEYQGVQHYQPIGFFGGDEALTQRQTLDEQKRRLCEEHGVTLIEWPYSVEPTLANLSQMLKEGQAQVDA